MSIYDVGICRRVLACIVIGSGDPNTPTPQVRKLYLAANTHTGSKLNQTQFADLTWSKWAAGSTLLVWQHLERLRKNDRVREQVSNKQTNRFAKNNGQLKMM